MNPEIPIDPRRRVYRHDYVAIRKSTQPGKIPVLKFQDGTQHALLPTGQQISLAPNKCPKGMSGKAWRRQLKAARKPGAAVLNTRAPSPNHS